MNLGTVDIYAVSFAALASLVLGYAWYSNLLFKKYWIKSMGRTPAQFERDRKKMDGGVEFVLSALTSVVMAAILAHLMDLTEAHSVIGGLYIGLYIWMGFVVIVLGSLVLHERRHSDYFVITAGHRLVELMLMGAIIGAVA